MLGTIHSIWDKSKSARIKQGDKFVAVQGKQLAVKLEENNQLRVSLVKVISDRTDQYRETISNILNLLESRRKDLSLVQQELQECTRELTTADLDQEDEEKLFAKIRDRRAIQKNHLNEISKLEAQTTVEVNYRVVKSGVSAVLPPGLIVQPEFLPEPVCWCPHNIPACTLVEETTSVKEVLPLIASKHITATGAGLEHCHYKTQSKFIITTKDSVGQLRDVSPKYLVVESKEADLRSSCLQKKKGTYEISYFADIKEEEKPFSLSVTFLGSHIQGSPFSVKVRQLLLEFSSSGNHSKDWLDAAVLRMSDIPRARLWVYLHDVNGLEVYSATGETTCKWAQNSITSNARKQWHVDKHSNKIRLDNGDEMMIIGKNAGSDAHNRNSWAYDIYRSYNLIINKGSSLAWNPKRLIIALDAPSVPGWTAPENLISFSSTGFTPTKEGNWPKFTGIFRIYFQAV